jgi:pseudouridine-5'-phosphate glycosidase
MYERLGPTVLFESAVLTHWLKYPDNVTAISQMYAAAELTGARPATAAIIDGIIRTGIDQFEIELLCRGGASMKAQSRDIAYCVAKKLTAGATVSATIAIADEMGFPVVATGGIEGVHRGYEEELQISPDIFEMSRRPSVVVCSGAKSMVDLGNTLAALGSYGVPVVGYQTSEFPALFTRRSGQFLEQRVDSPEEAAAYYRAMQETHMLTAMLLCVPVPEEHALEERAVLEMVSDALSQARILGVKGPALTPFLLAALDTLSSGRTTTATLALLSENARVAGQVAVALAER